MSKQHKRDGWTSALTGVGPLPPQGAVIKRKDVRVGECFRYLEGELARLLDNAYRVYAQGTVPRSDVDRRPEGWCFATDSSKSYTVYGECSVELLEHYSTHPIPTPKRVRNASSETAVETGTRVHKEIEAASGKWIVAEQACKSWIANGVLAPNEVRKSRFNESYSYRVSVDPGHETPGFVRAPIARAGNEAVTLTPGKLIDGLTPDECLNRFIMNMREAGGSNGEPAYLMTRAQLRVAKILFSHDVRVKVKASEKRDAAREKAFLSVDDDRWDL